MDDIGTVHCVFDNGRTLGVIPGVDDFHIVSEDSEPTEDEEMNIFHKTFFLLFIFDFPFLLWFQL